MKYWNPLRNTLLGTLGAMGVGLLLCRMLRYDVRFLWLLTGLGSMAGISASLAVQRGRICQGICIGATVITSGIGGAWLIGNLWGGVYAMAAAIAVYLAVFTGGYGFPAKLGLVTVTALLIDMLMTTGIYQSISCVAAIVAGIMTIDGMRDRSLRKAQLQNQIDRVSHGATGLHANSVMLITLFLIAAVLAAVVSYLFLRLLWMGATALISKLSGPAGDLFAWLRVLQQRFYAWFISHFQYTPEGPHVTEDFDDVMDWTPGTGLLMTSSVLMIALFIIGAGMIAAAGAVFVYQVRKPKANSSDTSMDYVEEYEALERPKWRLFHRKRKERHPDYQGAMKVRFAFQILLKSRMKSDPSAFSKTPNELRDDKDENEDSLIDAYNRVRYGDGNVPQGQLEKVEKWLKNNQKNA